MCVQTTLISATFLGWRYRKSPRGNFTARSLLNLYRTSHYEAHMLRGLDSYFLSALLSSASFPRRNTIVAGTWHEKNDGNVFFANLYLDESAQKQQQAYHYVSFITIYIFSFFFHLVPRGKGTTVSRFLYPSLITWKKLVLKRFRVD